MYKMNHIIFFTHFYKKVKLLTKTSKPFNSGQRNVVFGLIENYTYKLLV